jgi:spermidine synthase
MGTTVYAFGIMLATMLVGMAWGSRLVSRGLGAHDGPVETLALSQLLLGLSVLALLPLWDELPKLFVLTAYFRPSFLLTESIRFLGCFLVLFLPAILLGVSFPLLLKVRARSLVSLAADFGSIYFWNGVGCILGSVVAGFLILPRLGSELTLRVLAALSILLGVVVVLGAEEQTRFRGRLAALSLAGCVMGFWLVPSWDLLALNAGAHALGLYSSDERKLLFYHEDVEGGVTSVVQQGATRTLLTNGKFQGNDGGEMAAQRNFALAPLVFAHGFSRALVIGLGTGVTAATVNAYPYPAEDVVEISPGIAFAADRFFSHVNGGVLQDPRVHLHIADGRNFLLLSDARYDLISIELSNIWFAGAANLYSRDFYRLCRDHLLPGGVMEQWIQIHHIDTVDLISVLKSMHEVFPHMAMFVAGGQGMLVGSMDPLEVDYQVIAGLNERPEVQRALVDADVTALDLLGVLTNLYLYEDNLSETVRSEPHAAVNTDSYPFLEYTTPRGNQLPYALLANLKLLELRRYSGLPHIHGVPLPKVDYLRGLLALDQGKDEQALRYLERSLAQGNTDPRCRMLLDKARAQIAGRMMPAPALRQAAEQAQ